MRTIIICFLFVSSLSFAQSFKKGDKMYVWWEDGIPVYKDSSLQSEIIDTLDFGSMVILNSQRTYGNIIRKNVIKNCSEAKDMCYLFGWLIQIDLINKKGYVNSSFLGNFKPPTGEFPDYFEFLNANYRLQHSSQDTLFDNDESSISYFHSFDQGIMLKDSHSGGGRIQEIHLMLPNMAYNELLLILIYFEGLYGISIPKTEIWSGTAMEFYGMTSAFSESYIHVLMSGSATHLIIQRDWE